MKTSNGSASHPLSGETATSESFLQHSFYALLESSDDGCFIVDTSFNIIFLNEQANKFSQRTYNVCYQLGDNLLWPAPENRKKKLREVLLSVINGETVKYEVEFIKPSGGKVYSDCRYSPIKDQHGHVTGVCVLLIDITAKKELEALEAKQTVFQEKHGESHKLFEQFMENSPLRAWITDEKGVVHYINPLHQEFLGIDKNSIGKHLSEIFPEDMAKEYSSNNCEVINTGKAIELIQKAKKKNGAVGIYKVIKFPIYIKNELMVAGWAIDLTKQAQLQKRLLKQERLNKRAIIRSIIETQEKERRQLSVELHDNVNQILSSCKLMLDVAREARANAPEMIEKSFQSLTEVIVEIRKISHDLNPSSIEDFGLVEAITEMIERINSSGKLLIEFNHLHYRQQDLSSESRITIYRIIQEGLNNILKYAAAPNVWITLYSNCTQILITIRDNGIGFNLQETKKGLGLRNILHRAEYHQGKVKIQTSPGKGCTLKVLLPIPTT
jgi:PAS domain S-box-containing protein